MTYFTKKFLHQHPIQPLLDHRILVHVSAEGLRYSRFQIHSVDILALVVALGHGKGSPIFSEGIAKIAQRG